MRWRGEGEGRLPGAALSTTLLYIVTWQGDSGGPLTVVDSSTGRHTVVGTNSWGDGCGKVVWIVVCCTALV